MPLSLPSRACLPPNGRGEQHGRPSRGRRGGPAAAAHASTRYPTPQSFLNFSCKPAGPYHSPLLSSSSFWAAWRESTTQLGTSPLLRRHLHFDELVREMGDPEDDVASRSPRSSP